MVLHIFLYCSLTGDDTTDVPPTQEPTVRLTIVWIIVGAVALIVLIAIVCLFGFLYSRKRKRMGTLGFNTGMRLYIMGVKACLQHCRKKHPPMKLNYVYGM